MAFTSYENINYLTEICNGFLKNIGLSPNKNDVQKYLSESIEYFGTPEYAAIPIKDRNKMVITRVRNIFEREAREPPPSYFQQTEDDTALFFKKLDYLEAERKIPPATAPQVAPTPIPAPTPEILMPAPQVAQAPGNIHAMPIIINSADRQWTTTEPARDIWTWNGPGTTGSTMRFIRIFGPIKGQPGQITITGVGGQTETVVFDESGNCLKGLGTIKNLSLPWKIAIKGFNGSLNFRGRDNWKIVYVEKISNYTYLGTELSVETAQEFAPGDECAIAPFGHHFKVHGISAQGYIIVQGHIDTPIVDRAIINLSRQVVLIFAGAQK